MGSYLRWLIVLFIVFLGRVANAHEPRQASKSIEAEKAPAASEQPSTDKKQEETVEVTARAEKPGT